MRKINFYSKRNREEPYSLKEETHETENRENSNMTGKRVERSSKGRFMVFARL
jgi:hypothetical protein